MAPSEELIGLDYFERKLFLLLLFFKCKLAQEISLKCYLFRFYFSTWKNGLDTCTYSGDVQKKLKMDVAVVDEDFRDWT